MSSELVRIIALLAYLTGGVAAAATDPAAKCAMAKQKAAGKKFTARLKCYSTAVSKKLPVDPECLMKADTKFGDAFTKAEAAGGCTVVGDAPAQELAVDSAVTRIAGAEPATPLPPVFGAPCGTTCPGVGAGISAFVCAGNIGSSMPRVICAAQPLASAPCNGQQDCELIAGPGFICVSTMQACGGTHFCAKPCP